MEQRGSAVLGWYAFRTKRIVRKMEDHNTLTNLTPGALFRGLTEDPAVSGVKSCVTSRGRPI